MSNGNELAICPKCGGATVVVKKCRSIAFPNAKPFFRLACNRDKTDCGWFGRIADEIGRMKS